MGGGYDRTFNQYQALPTNLQNYTGGVGPASLANPQANGIPAGAGAPAGQMSGFNNNPFVAQSPYAFMQDMGRNWGGPPVSGMDYNRMASNLSGVPEKGYKSKSLKKHKKQQRQMRRRLERLQAKLSKAKNTKGAAFEANGGGGEGPGPGGPSGSAPGTGPHR